MRAHGRLKKRLAIFSVRISRALERVLIEHILYIHIKNSYKLLKQRGTKSYFSKSKLFLQKCRKKFVSVLLELAQNRTVKLPGHVVCFSSHGLRHWGWNSCPQRGRRFSLKMTLKLYAFFLYAKNNWNSNTSLNGLCRVGL